MDDGDMGPAVGFLLAAISLLATVDHTQADSAEALRPRAVLEAGAIDSGTTATPEAQLSAYRGNGQETNKRIAKKLSADALGGIVFGIMSGPLQDEDLVETKDGRGPDTDGDSVGLDAERKGIVDIEISPVVAQADENVAATGRANGAGVIDSSRVKHIQVPADSGRSTGGLQAVSNTLPVRTDERGTGGRIAKKLGAGSFVGIVSGLVSAGLLGRSVSSDLGIDGIGVVEPIIYGWYIGSIIGTSVGVTLVDPHDRFIMTLTGASVGTWLGIQGAELSGGWSMLLCPLLGATIASELWRDSTENSRFSIGLAPDPKGRLSAVATLRF